MRPLHTTPDLFHLDPAAPGRPRHRPVRALAWLRRALPASLPVLADLVLTATPVVALFAVTLL